MLHVLIEKSRSIKQYKYWKIVLALCLALFVECFFYNFRYWESLSFKPVRTFAIQYGSGLTTIDEKNKIYKITSPKNAYIEIVGIDEHIDNLYINLFTAKQAKNKRAAMHLQIDVTDAGNTTYWKLPTTETVNGIPESQYIRLHLIGKSPKMRIHIHEKANQDFRVSKFEINAKRPFYFRGLRFLVIALVSFLLLVFRPSSELYKLLLDWSDRKQKCWILFSVVLQMLLFLLVYRIFRNPAWQKTTWLAELQYNYLAESFTRGHVYLDAFTPPDILKHMANPYDTVLRDNLLRQAGQKIIIDFAYYNGKYFCYFGVLPVVLFYLPYLLITGNPLSTGTLILVASFLFISATYWLLYLIIRKYFNHITLGVYLLMSSVLITGSEILYCLQMPTLYSVPDMLSILFGFIGLACWIKAKQNVHQLSYKWLIIGALCMVAIGGCRPPFSIFAFVAFPLFWSQIKAGLFFTRKGMKNTLCIIAPFLCVGSLLLYYNYIRFDNPLNFGATYNLTGFDMTHRGFIADRFWLGLFELLFQPFHFITRFPYMQTIASHMGLQSDYQGQIINEPLLGGFFAFNLIGAFVVLIGKFKESMQSRKVLGIAAYFLFCAFLIISIDIQAVGMTLRYITDFAVLIMFSAVLVIFTLYDKYYNDKSGIYSLLQYSVIITSGLCIFINYFSLMALGRYNNLLDSHTYTYYLLKYLVFSFFSIR